MNGEALCAAAARLAAQLLQREWAAGRDGEDKPDFIKLARGYRTALGADPSCTTALLGLGSALLAGGEAAEAVDPLRSAVEADPWHPEAPARLGNALLELGDLDAARRAFRKALALEAVGTHPPRRHALSGLAQAALGAALADGDALAADEAAATIEELLVMQPKSTGVLRLGLAIVARGGYPEHAAALAGGPASLERACLRAGASEPPAELAAHAGLCEDALLAAAERLQDVGLRKLALDATSMALAASSERSPRAWRVRAAILAANGEDEQGQRSADRADELAAQELGDARHLEL